MSPLPHSASPAGPHFCEIPEEYKDLYTSRRPDTLLPRGVGGGGGDCSNDPPDHDINNDNSSSTSTSNIQDLLEDDTNQVPLVFEPFTHLPNTNCLMTRKALRKQSSNGGKTKVQKPDPFNRNDPQKLCAFIVQCEINPQANLKSFCKEWAKVTFTQSYLKGIVLEYFEPDLLGVEALENRPLWMDHWQALLYELQTNFGPHNPIADVEALLE